MKKILLLLIFICSFGFADVGGFNNLKWGASQKEVKEYLIKTYNLHETSMYEFADYTQVEFENIEFSNIDLKEICFYFNKDGKFFKWTGESYTIRGDKKNLIENLKKKYDLTKGDSSKDNFFRKYTKTELINVYFHPDMIEFAITSIDYL